MRIGITGATGLIGKALIDEALKCGHQVVGFSRMPHAQQKAQVEWRLYTIEGEIDLSGLDALVHLAGESILGYWSSAKCQRMRDSRVDSTQFLVQQLQRFPEVKTFICASGSSYYGDAGDVWLKEDAPNGKGVLAEICRDWERAALNADSAECRVVILRTGMVLASESRVFQLLKGITQLQLASPIGSGQQWIPWIHLQDQVGVILHALTGVQLKGPVNLVAPHPVTNRQMMQRFCEVWRRYLLMPIPSFTLRLLLGKFSEIALQSQRMSCSKILESGYVFQFETLDQALKSMR